MEWWHVVLRVRTAPGTGDGTEVAIVFDVEAESKEDAVFKAKAALVARAEVYTAAPEVTV